MLRVICLFAFCISILQYVSAQQYGSFKDPRDGQVYKTVIIGDQEWMAENLNTIKFRNGDLIPNSNIYPKGNEPRWYDPHIHDIEFIKVSVKSFGKFYNWNAVNDPRGLAPQGWEIPSKSDWEALINFLNPNEKFKSAADKMINKEDWGFYGNCRYCTNESGFTALCCSQGTISLFPLGGADFWAKNQYDAGNAWSVNLRSSTNILSQYEPPSISLSPAPREFDLAVRCVRRVNNTAKNKIEQKQNTIINNNDNAQNKDCDKYLKEFNSITNRLINWYNTNNLKAIENTYQESQLALKNIQSCYSNPYYKNEADAILARWKKAYDDSERRIRSASSSSLSKPRYGDVNTNNYNVSVNAWQCSKCGVLSKGQQEPHGYENGNCVIGSSHNYREANTSRGYQCKKCGRRYYLLNKGRGERGPCCGEFGNCSIGTDHDWRVF